MPSKQKQNKNTTLIIIIAILGISLIVIGILYIRSSMKHASTASTSDASVLGANNTSITGASSLYPNPQLTPGHILPNVTKLDICVSGYSSKVRNVTEQEKKQVYKEYDLSYPQPAGAYEVDHFISLELGGSNDIDNLWPEPANPTPGFHQKDVVENYLHKEVCNGTLTLQQAQDQIKTDWYKVYGEINR